MTIVLLVLLVIILLLIALGYVVFFFACVRVPIPPDPSKSKSLRQFAEDINAGAQWFLDQSPERVQISSDDGLRLEIAEKEITSGCVCCGQSKRQVAG